MLPSGGSRHFQEAGWHRRRPLCGESRGRRCQNADPGGDPRRGSRRSRSCRPGRATARSSSRLRSTWPGRPRRGARRHWAALSLRSSFLHVTADLVGGGFHAVLITPFGVDDEGAAVGQAVFIDVHVEVARVSAWVGSPTSGNLALPTAGEVSCQALCEKCVSVVTM
jgi:hypothetical protein